jgi:hypothetical protein
MGIIMIIFILLILSYFINFKYNNNDAKIHNLINKKILNIKDKIINNKRNTNNNTDDKVLEEDIINNKVPKHEREHEREREAPEQELIQNHIESLDQCVAPEQDININTKVNFKNNINDRMNDREAHEIIKYKIDDEVQQRDLNVLLNPIYPPLARVERPIFDNLIRMNFGQATRGSEDTFRLMGYLLNTNKNDADMGGNVWKLFGRQTYKGSSIGEYYVSPVNDHTSDMKIYLKNEMMPKDKIRDIYSLPTEVHFESPFFSKNAYTVNELPKSDLNSNYL